MLTTLFLKTFQFKNWGACFTIDLVPLSFAVGVTFIGADLEAIFPAHTLRLNLPTLVLDFKWAGNATIANAEKLQAKMGKMT